MHELIGGKPVVQGPFRGITAVFPATADLAKQILNSEGADTEPGILPNMSKQPLYVVTSSCPVDSGGMSAANIQQAMNCVMFASTAHLPVHWIQFTFSWFSAYCYACYVCQLCHTFAAAAVHGSEVMALHHPRRGLMQPAFTAEAISATLPLITKMVECHLSKWEASPVPVMGAAEVNI